MSQSQEPWTLQKAKDFYGIEIWGRGQFSLSDQGDVQVCSKEHNRAKEGVSVGEIISQLSPLEQTQPILLRFGHLIQENLQEIYQAFDQAIDEHQYGGCYCGTYPIKVNKEAQTLEFISKFGATFSHGLEVGTKAELIIAISFSRPSSQMIIINGYKDKDFIELGLMAQKIGLKIIFVFDQLAEISPVLTRAKELNIDPSLGLRFKPFGSTHLGGDNSVFGFNAKQILQAISILKDHNMLHCLKLLHYHLGSPLPNIADIQQAAQDASRVYANLVKKGAPLEMIDVGGGLAVNYSTYTHARPESMNYTLLDYCKTIIEAIIQTLKKDQIPHPTILTEAGRASVASSSMLVFKTVRSVAPTSGIDISLLDLPQTLKNFLKNPTPDEWQKCYEETFHYREASRKAFRLGRITLQELAEAEDFFYRILHAIRSHHKEGDLTEEQEKTLHQTLSNIYFGNFSVFKSLPDVWGIGQIFPVMPIHRLTEEPTEHGIISDLTCDNDAKIDQFASDKGLSHTLKLHPDNGEPYYLGVFLVGAYQEALSNLHNLFGSVGIFSVDITEDNAICVSKVVSADTVESVLAHGDYKVGSVFNRFQELLNQKEMCLSKEMRRFALDTFTHLLHGPTYHL